MNFRVLQILFFCQKIRCWCRFQGNFLFPRQKISAFFGFSWKMICIFVSTWKMILIFSARRGRYQKTAVYAGFRDISSFSVIMNILWTRHQDCVTGLDWGKYSSENGWFGGWMNQWNVSAPPEKWFWTFGSTQKMIEILSARSGE